MLQVFLKQEEHSTYLARHIYSLSFFNVTDQNKRKMLQVRPFCTTLLLLFFYEIRLYYILTKFITSLFTMK
jgi:hypothetical protein